MTHPPTDPERALFLLERPLPQGELLARLGFDLDDPAAEEALDDLLADARVVAVGDGRIASVARLLDGLVLWHRVDEVEAASRMLGLGIDVLPAVMLIERAAIEVGDDEIPLQGWAGAGEVGLDREPAVALPPGWAPDLAAGDLVAVVTEGARLRLVPGDAAPPAAASDRSPSALASAVREVASQPVWRLRHLGSGDPDDRWVLDVAAAGPALLADHGPLLRSLPPVPLGEALLASGLFHHSGVVMGPGLGLQDLETYLVGRIIDRQADARSTTIFEACGIAWGALSGDVRDGAFDQEATTQAVRFMVDDPYVADRMVECVRKAVPDVASEAERRLRPMRSAHGEDPGLAWVHAATLIAQSRPHDAVAILETMVGGLGTRGAADEPAHWAEAVTTTAHLRAIRGDLRSAAELYRLTGNAHLAREATSWLDPRGSSGLRARPGAGRPRRNDRCGCGSGRKVKVCCPVAAPSVAPTWWKLQTWALRGRRSDEMLDGPAALDVDLDLRVVMHLHDVVATAVMLEDGGLARSLEEIGALLPPEERQCAAPWRRARHRVWTVESRSGVARWTDASSGARIEVVDRVGARPLPTSGAVLAAVVPASSGGVVVGAPVPVGDDDVDLVVDMVEADLDSLALGLIARALLDTVEGVDLDRDRMRPPAA